MKKLILTFCYVANLQALLNFNAGQELVAGVRNHDIPTIFGHGLGGTKNQGKYYQAKHSDEQAFIEGSLEIFNFRDYSDIYTSCLGQDDDINTLHHICKKHKKVMYVGVSRGAATGANYLGKMQPNNVVCAILESPYDSGQSVISNIIGPFSNFPGLTSLLYRSAAQQFPNYNPNGIHPIEVAHKIPQHIAVLIVCSKEDKLIPTSASVHIYNKIRESGHQHAYLLLLDHGKHANILWGHDGYTYRNVVHAMLKHHNLPHNGDWARAGHERFKQCQPRI